MRLNIPYKVNCTTQKKLIISRFRLTIVYTLFPILYMRMAPTKIELLFLTCLATLPRVHGTASSSRRYDESGSIGGRLEDRRDGGMAFWHVTFMPVGVVFHGCCPAGTLNMFSGEYRDLGGWAVIYMRSG